MSISCSCNFWLSISQYKTPVKIVISRNCFGMVFIIHRLNDEYITVVFAVPGSLLLQKKANSDTFR